MKHALDCHDTFCDGYCNTPQTRLNEAILVIEQAKNIIQTLLEQQGGLLNEKTNMVYNLNGFIDSANKILNGEN